MIVKNLSVTDVRNNKVANQQHNKNPDPQKKSNLVICRSLPDVFLYILTPKLMPSPTPTTKSPIDMKNNIKNISSPFSFFLFLFFF
jgi:hypothetical protein